MAAAGAFRKVDGEWIARLYYFAHQPVDNNVVEIVLRDGSRFKTRWRGETPDPIHPNPSKPSTTVELEAWFECADTTLLDGA